MSLPTAGQQNQPPPEQPSQQASQEVYDDSVEAYIERRDAWLAAQSQGS